MTSQDKASNKVFGTISWSKRRSRRRGGPCSRPLRHGPFIFKTDTPPFQPTSMPPLTRLVRPTIVPIKPIRASWPIHSKTFAMSTGAAETDTQAANAASTSGVTVSSLEQTLKEKLGAEHVDIEDMSGNPSSLNLSNRTTLKGSNHRWLRPSFQRYDSFSAIR